MYPLNQLFYFVPDDIMLTSIKIVCIFFLQKWTQSPWKPVIFRRITYFTRSRQMNDFLLKMRVRLTRWTCKLILCNLSGGFCCLMPGGMSGIPSITGIFTLPKCNSPSKATSPKVTFNTTMRQIYQFLFSFFALLITLVAPMVIGKGHPEKNEESPFPETNKTAAESHDEKQNLSLNRIMIIKENYSHEETNLPQTLRGKCKLSLDRLNIS